MPLSVAELHPVLHDLFHNSADELARAPGFCRRNRKLNGSRFAQALVFTLLENPNATLDDFADTAADLLDTPLSPQAFDQRFSPQATEFLRDLFLESFNRSFNSLRPTLLPVLRRFRGVFLRDATLVTLPPALATVFPGCGSRVTDPVRGAAVKLVFEAEVTTGELTEVSLLPGLDNERTAEVAGKPLPEGALLLEDMGFFSGERLQASVEQGVYFLIRVPAWTALFDERGRRLDLVRLLRRTPGEHLEQPVRILHGRRLGLRLLAVRLPAAQAEQRRTQLRRQAKERGRPVSVKRLQLCAWNILLTNAPPELLAWHEAGVLRRVRWQIELVFKVFKSEGRIDHSRSRSPYRVLCELYAKLLGMVVQQWALLSAGYGMLRHSARRAARRLRRRALAWLEALGEIGRLVREVTRLAQTLERSCRIQRRQASPSTLDRLSALDEQFQECQMIA
jgi:hypothetical protein